MDSNSCQIIMSTGLVMFCLGIFAIIFLPIIITIAENRYNSVILTADEAKELSDKRGKEIAESHTKRAIKNLNERVTHAARSGDHSITQHLRIITPSGGSYYLGKVDKEYFPWCVNQIKSYFEGRGYSVTMEDKKVIKISW